MKDQHAEILLKFVNRPGMYVLSEDKEHVVSFITGFELGATGQCEFTSILTEKLSTEYGVKAYATGWPDQVERFAKNENCSWFEIFERLTNELLFKNSK